MQDSTASTMTKPRASGGQEQAMAFEDSETSALLKKKASPFLCVWKQRYCNSDKCVSSKAALLILLWSFVVGLIYKFDYITSIGIQKKSSTVPILYALKAIIYCFYPLAGFLADNKFGRYKTVIRSLYSLAVLAGLIILTGLIVLTEAIFNPTKQVNGLYISITTYVYYLLCIPGFVGFNANVIQFGMDQLHDSPGDHQSLFIHWFVWVHSLGLLVAQLSWISLLPIIIYIVLGLLVLTTILFIVSLCVAHRRPNWFLTDPARLNPYKLVHQVSKFARQHKVPVCRSSFTYCEDELPSGLDLGKDKYGGPFTTEQVEDVKVFYGILKVLFALGPMFFLNIAADPMLYFYARHGYYNLSGSNTNNVAKEDLINRGILTPLLIVLCIPLYICLLRPFASRYIPGMLKRLGLGIVLMVTSLISTFVMDTILHFTTAPDKDDYCMFKENNSTTPPPPFQDTYPLVIQRSLYALSNMLIYIALYEFICSQSPHSMKGLLIGLSFAIKGVFETLASILIYPIYLTYKYIRSPSCGMVYYLVNIGVGVLAVLVFTCVARRYKYRERDEPCHVRHYAEEYYSKVGPKDNDRHHKKESGLLLPDTRL